MAYSRHLIKFVYLPLGPQEVGEPDTDHFVGIKGARTA